MNVIDKIGKYYLGAGGLGDLLVSMTTFYDQNEDINLIWFADSKELIKEAINIFPKFKTTLIFSKDSPDFFQKWFIFADHQNCLGTGITPKELVYKEWDHVNIFDKYGVIEFPNFVNEGVFEDYSHIIFPHSLTRNKKLGIMLSGKSSPGKQKVIKPEIMENIDNEFNDYDIFVFGKYEGEHPKRWLKCDNQDLVNQMINIKRMDKFISVDSWCKTWSSLCGIDTIVYDNIYDNNYLNPMGGVDWGHYVFINPWTKIEFREQK